MDLCYSPEELGSLIGSFGSDVQIDRTVRIYGGKGLRVGSHVRIDPYTVISAGAGLTIGSYVHIAQFCLLIASAAPLTIKTFAGLSSRVSIYTANEDYSGESLTNPTVPLRFRSVKTGPVTLGRHCIVGSGAIVMPGVELGDGVAVGALAYVRKSLPEFAIAVGNPAKVIGKRKRRLLELERELVDSRGATEIE